MWYFSPRRMVRFFISIINLAVVAVLFWMGSPAVAAPAGCGGGEFTRYSFEGWYEEYYDGEILPDGEDPPAPIDITTIEDLQKIGSDDNFPCDGVYYLTQDIDASATSSWNDGEGFKPLRNFSGSLDGQGHAIQGLFINRPKEKNVGLFAEMTGVVTNLELSKGSVIGWVGVGGLAGWLGGDVKDCRVSMNVTGFAEVGMFAGNCYGSLTQCGAEGSVLGMDLVGGIAGLCWTASLMNCRSSASVTGVSEVGGLAGGFASNGYILGCYAVGPVTAWLGGAGGLVPEEDNVFSKGSEKALSVMASFWCPEMTGQDTSLGGEPKSPADLKDYSTFASCGWDLATVWTMVNGSAFPSLVDVDASPSSETATLTIEVEGDGFVNMSKGGSFVCAAQTQTLLSAVPNPGNRFIGWTGTGLPEVGLATDSYLAVMTEDKTITAVFAPETIEIDSIEELQLIGRDAAHPLRGYYRITADINASATADWNDGAGFDPIGKQFIPGAESDPDFEYFMLTRYPFLGTLDGAGHRISGLAINRPERVFSGLFSMVGRGAVVQDIVFEAASVLGHLNTGVVSGANGGLLSGIEVSGALQASSIRENFLMFYLSGTSSIGLPLPFFILGSYGPLTGWNDGVIQNCGASAEIVGAIMEPCTSYPVYYSGTNAFLGGLAGANHTGTMENSWAQVHISGGYMSGGLAGFNFGDMTRCYASGRIEHGYTMGGLAGYNEGNILDAYSVARLDDAKMIGGVAGDNQGVIERCYAAGATGSARPEAVMGGLAAASNNGEGFFVSSFWDLDVTGQTAGVPDMSGVGTGLNTAAMIQAAEFTGAGWDFDTVWDIREGASYPFLRGVGPASGEEPFTLTVAVEGEGAVNLLPDQMEFAPNSLVVLTAAPNGGNIFSAWYGEGLPEDWLRPETLTLTMDRNWSVTAQFVPEVREVETIDDLQRIGNSREWPLCGNYILTTHLNVPETETWNDGAGFLPMGSAERPFTGTFDGQNYMISNLHITSSASAVGLFGMISAGGEVRNLELALYVHGEEAGPVGGIAGINCGAIRGCETIPSLFGKKEVGGIAGRNLGTISCCGCGAAYIDAPGDMGGGVAGFNSGVISHCNSAGSVYGSNMLGGLVGNNIGDIEYSSATNGSVNCFEEKQDIGGLAGAHLGGILNQCGAMAPVYGTLSEHVGGLVGKLGNAYIRDCFAQGLVQGSEYVGGLIGYAAPTGYSSDNPWLARTYAAGAVSGTNAGGLVGAATATLENQLSRWDTAATGQMVSAAGRGFVTSLMKQAATYSSVGWDLGMVWVIVEGQDYPALRNMAVGYYACYELAEGEGNMPEGDGEASAEGHIPEAEFEAEAEGQFPDGETAEAETEGCAPDGETPEAETEGAPEGQTPITHTHGADQNGDGHINLTELLRVIQFFNSGGYRCSSQGVNTEDGFEPGPGDGHACGPHSSDYAPQDWAINLTELLRLIQFFNMGGYHDCLGGHTEDGFCVNAV